MAASDLFNGAVIVVDFGTATTFDIINSKTIVLRVVYRSCYKLMKYLISLYFDDNTNKQIYGYIEKVAVVTGNDYMLANHVPPHITVSSFEVHANVENNVIKQYKDGDNYIIDLASSCGFPSCAVEEILSNEDLEINMCEYA